MAGTVKTNAVQLGDSATATQNFTIRTNVDGTATVARGNVGATTQDILTIAADGTVKLPASIVPAFSAYNSTSQSIASGAFAKVTLNTEEFDTNNNFDSTTNYRFTPTIAGYYQINGTVYFGTSGSPTRGLAGIFKNGVEFKRFVDVQSAGHNVGSSVIVYLNGTTDYVELYAYIVATTPLILAGSVYTYFQGILIART